MRTLILLLLSFSSLAAVDTGAKRYSFGPNRTKDTAWNKANTRLDGNLRLGGLTFVDSLYYLGLDANNNVKLYPISAVVSGVVSVNGQTGVVTLDIPYYADSIKKNFDSILAHNLRLINLQYGVDTAKQNIRDEIASIPSVSLGDSIVVLYDSITAHNIRLINLRYMVDTGIANVYSWAWSNFLTSYSETDPLSFHQTDSNTVKNPVTYTYVQGAFYPLGSNPLGYLTASSISGKLNIADSNINGGYETYKHASITYQPIGSYISVGTSVNAVPLVSNSNNTITVSISTGVTGLGANVDAALGTPTSENFASAVTGELGTGRMVFKPADTSISASYTLTTRDLLRRVHCTNGSSINLTIPASLGTDFTCDVIREGAGDVVFVASSTTLNLAPTGTKIKTPGGVTIVSYATANTYLIIGAIE